MEKRPRKPRPDPGRRRIRRMSQSALIRSAAGIRLIRRAFQIRMTDDGSDPGRRRWTSTSRGRPSRSPPTTRTPSSSGSAPSSPSSTRCRACLCRRDGVFSVQARLLITCAGATACYLCRRDGVVGGERGRRTEPDEAAAAPCASESAPRSLMRHARRPAAVSLRRSAERPIGPMRQRATRFRLPWLSMPIWAAHGRGKGPDGGREVGVCGGGG